MGARGEKVMAILNFEWSKYFFKEMTAPLPSELRLRHSIINTGACKVGGDGGGQIDQSTYPHPPSVLKSIKKC